MASKRKTHDIPRWIYRLAEFVPIDRRREVPRGTRGVYALLQQRKEHFDVVYIGISTSGVRGRLDKHASKKKDWTHFSVYEVWPNVTEDELRQLEGLLRHIYRRDSRPTFHQQKAMYDLLMADDGKTLAEWKPLPLPAGLEKRRARKRSGARRKRAEPA